MSAKLSNEYTAGSHITIWGFLSRGATIPMVGWDAESLTCSSVLVYARWIDESW